MAKNKDLSIARARKKDEFYAQYEDIEKEMAYYEKSFHGKTVLMNCDDPTWSNFWKYFLNKFSQLGLKKIISTHFEKDGSPSYKVEYEGKTDSNGMPEILTTPLKENGDFRSEECVELLKEADIVTTNPPFSLFREYIALLMKHKKDFIILGNMNAVTYKEIFPYFIDNAIWLGATIHSGDRKFYVPDDYPLKAAGCGIDEKGKRFIRVKGVRWFTNIDHSYRHTALKLKTRTENLKSNKKMRKKLMKDYGLKDYPVLDNYNALEIPTSDSMPSDYKGVMAVPITFIDKHCPEQFEIIGNEYTLNIHKGRGYVNGKRIYARIFIRLRRC